MERQLGSLGKRCSGCSLESYQLMDESPVIPTLAFGIWKEGEMISQMTDGSSFPLLRDHCLDLVYEFRRL